jgi:hypothetical protein
VAVKIECFSNLHSYDDLLLLAATTLQGSD